MQYTKLQKENKFNKKMLSNILNLNDDILYTKEDILERIKNCKIEDEKKLVVDTLNLINLKFEINEKKSILKSKNDEAKTTTNRNYYW